MKERDFSECVEADAYAEYAPDVYLCIEYDWNAEEYVVCLNDVEIFDSQLKEEVMRKFREIALALGLSVSE